jgi:phosphoribosylanthranilate isomerase
MIIKVCGMRQPENIRQVAALGVDWMGFIFWAGSKRLCTTEPGEWNLEKTEKSTFRRVGVFVNALAEDMMETAARYGLDYLQLHGDESPELCHSLQKRGFSLIKAFSIATAADLKRTAAYEGRTDYYLFDTACEGYGGSGKSFDWSLPEAYEGETPFLLSGGIHPGSIESIRRFHHPRFAGIDLNSGFESAPGLKDIEKLTSFIKQLTVNSE